jgi:hypothetical protein
MKAEITLDKKKNKPVIKLIAENESEDMSLELLAVYKEFTIALDFQDIGIHAISQQETTPEDDR